MARLSTKKRKRMRTTTFAVPKGKGKNPQTNAYPIPDRSHAANALSRVSQHGSPQEKRMVRRKVKSRFGIGPGGSSGGTTRKTTGTKRKKTGTTRKTTGTRRKRR